MGSGPVTTPDGLVKSETEMTAPGTKTKRSLALLALATAPALLLARMEKEKGSEPHVFPVRYDSLHAAWDKARRFLAGC